MRFPESAIATGGALHQPSQRIRGRKPAKPAPIDPGKRHHKHVRLPWHGVPGRPFGKTVDQIPLSGQHLKLLPIPHDRPEPFHERPLMGNSVARRSRGQTPVQVKRLVAFCQRDIAGPVERLTIRRVTAQLPTLPVQRLRSR